MISYSEFLKSKAIVSVPTGIRNPTDISDRLRPDQRACVSWALQRGRAALFLGTGLGKTADQCEWARHVEDYTSKPVLILAPLAVSHQTIAEAKKILSMDVIWADSQECVGKRGVYVTNYQKLDRFDPSIFGGVVWDESSIIKSSEGKTRKKLMEAFSQTPFRLACSATPAPNDYMELGQHAEALGIMRAVEMLSMFFMHDGTETQRWHLKRHAEKDFWRWLASWSIAAQKPSDIGFPDDGFRLPPLSIHEHIIDCGGKALPGELFAMPARTLQERRGVRKDTVAERTEALRQIIEQSPDDAWLVWCNLNIEAESISAAASMQNVTGSDTDEHKAQSMLDFASGALKRMTSKPSLCGFGMNWQNCHRIGFLGLSDSWEQMYQAIRRCWRFGQKHPVDVHIVISSLETEVLQNIKRKEQDAQRMQAALVGYMADMTRSELTDGASRTQTEYTPTQEIKLPSWIKK